MPSQKLLRLLTLALLLANGVYFAWGHGLLLPYGFGPATQNEPQRLAQQMNPQAVRILSADEFKRVEEELKQEQAPKECLQSGPLDATQSAALRQTVLPTLPADSWTLDETAVTARWIVYMGKYPGADVLARKRAEVLAMNLKPEALNNTSLEPGFSLGGFDTRADADAELARLVSRGLHTAHVVQERAAGVVYSLKLPAVTAALSPKLADLRAALGSQQLHTCN